MLPSDDGDAGAGDGAARRFAARIDRPHMRQGAWRLLVTVSAFALAAGTNTLSVELEARRGHLTRRFGRRAWYVHLALVTPPWVGFLALLPGLGRHVRWPLPRRLRPLGAAFLAIAVLLWLQAYRQLGAVRVANGDHFGRRPRQRVAGGVFRFLANPMYDSYALGLVGLALLRRNAAYLLLAGESYLLLN